ncbi:retrovirus-related pol polyprotein from transposon 17.6 [Tanacetum coccineum]
MNGSSLDLSFAPRGAGLNPVCDNHKAFDHRISRDARDCLISQGNFFLKAPLLQDHIGGQKKHGKTSSFDESRGFPIAQPIVCARKERLLTSLAAFKTPLKALQVLPFIPSQKRTEAPNPQSELPGSVSYSHSQGKYIVTSWPPFAFILAGTSSSSPAVTKALIKPILPDILLLNNPLLLMVLQLLPFLPLKSLKLPPVSIQPSLQSYRMDGPFVTAIRDYINAPWGLSAPATVGLLNPRHVMIYLASQEEFVPAAWVRSAYPRAYSSYVCMEVNISQPLPSKVWIGTGKDEGFYQKMVFEGKVDKSHLRGMPLATSPSGAVVSLLRLAGVGDLALSTIFLPIPRLGRRGHRALVDTGASHKFISKGKAKRLGLKTERDTFNQGCTLGIMYEGRPCMIPTVNVQTSVPTLSALQLVKGVKKGEESFVAGDEENGSSEDDCTVIAEVLEEFKDLMPPDEETST